MGVPRLRGLQEFGQVFRHDRIDVLPKLGHRLEEARALFCQIGIGGHRGQLVFPEVEILSGQRGEVRLVTHGPRLYLRARSRRHHCCKTEDRLRCSIFVHLLL